MAKHIDQQVAKESATVNAPKQEFNNSAIPQSELNQDAKTEITVNTDKLPFDELPSDKLPSAEFPPDEISADELSSDGSASAFEGTEFVNSQDEDLELKRKAEIIKNDPSGRSNY